ncbi:MAG: type I DNA topoisomerase [Acidimicrobiia bacterium]|nr:type I DNA topoisomerase [Acidimicrobiia bacterium]
MAKPLVIVESPAKARTISRFLGDDFIVESSIGHVRDLPRNAAEVPASHKGEAWARLGVDIEHDFKPLYIVNPDKRSQVAKLKRLLKDADELFLATDEDREGESIAWHLLEVLSPPAQLPVKRMVFHEITRGAIERAVDEWRELDRRLVDAQEARRILDRLYGYEVSPVLWKKVMPKLSAGRVQSVATRMIVDRERARMRFRSATWWDIEGTFATDEGSFGAGLVAVDGKRLATGRDFDESGRLAAGADASVLDEGAATGLAERLADSEFAVRSVEEKPYKRSPYAPFMTSTLQQESGRKLRYGSQRTMSIAQRLYENGYITYMRTDSTTLSETALTAARDQARQLYGPDYVPEQPRHYDKKVKNAQEAHEAIRPAGDRFRTPDEVASELADDEFRLYELIWKRTVASQMTDARGRSVQVRLGGTSSAGEDAEFAASGKIIDFPGFMRAYVEGSDDPNAALEDQEVRLPQLAEGTDLNVVELEPKGHQTQPPARFTEASLVKALEEMGVGRPSTYASIIGTIQDRGYVWKKGSALVPSFVAFSVVALLEQHFADLVDYAFTARMEDDLDGIASGEEEAIPWLRRFYFGNGREGLHDLVHNRLGEIDAREVNSIPLAHGEDDGDGIVVRVGRYGPYLQRGEDTVSIPEDMPPDELTPERAEELLQAPSGDRQLGEDPETGLPVFVKAGRFGPYVQLGEMQDGAEKPKTASLFKDMSPDTVTIEDALRLLSLPRVLGNHPDDGEEIVALNGRYGPYIKKGSDTRSLDAEEQLFTIDIDGALALLAEPKRRRGQRAAAAPLRELGDDPASGAPVVVKDGRFGPYVTDGTTNASLRKGDSVEDITIERAAELLEERRQKAPLKKAAKRAKKATKKKKATAKKTAAKKAAKKQSS